MKVTFCAHDRPGYLAGGPNAWLRRLLNDLRLRGIEGRVLFMTHRGAHPNLDAIRDDGFECSSTDISAPTGELVRWILEKLRQDPPDVFVPNLSVAGYFAGRWAREAGIPAVGILHSDDEFHRGLQDTFVFGLEAYRLSSLVCVSRFIESQVIARQPAPGILVRRIPYGVPMPSRLAVQNSSSLRFAYIGRLVEEQKRISEVVKAMCRAAREVPGTEYAIFGEGADGNVAARSLALHGNGLPVRLMGAVDNCEMQKRLLDYQGFVLLSDYEGIPIALMEAMACGLVPVCLEISSGVPELITHNTTGLLVKDREDDFVAAIRRLANDPMLRQKLSRNASDLIEREYSRSVCADRWAALLHQLCEVAGSKRSIHMPFILRLPPVHKDLVREDRRLGLMGLLRRGLTERLSSEQQQQFVEPKLRPEFLDRYGVRTSIFHALQERLEGIHGVVLDVGCGEMPYKKYLEKNCKRLEQYIGLDLARAGYGVQPDLIWDGNKIPLSDEAVDCALATELFEHCPEPEKVMKEIFRVLRKDGILFFTVPFLWPLHEAPFDEYRYTPYSLRRHLENAGFKTVEIEVTGGWDASLAQMLGLWVRRRPFSDWKRLLLSYALWPLIRWLYRKDTANGEPYRREMITGLTGRARKV